MTKKLDILLYAGLFFRVGGIFISPVSELFGFSPLVQEELYSFGACLFCILAFNILGYFTMRISSWLNVSYALNIRRRWRIVVIYLLVMLMFFLLNYGLLVSAKLLAGGIASFYFLCRGKFVLVLVWLVELVILGLLLAFRAIREMLRLQQHTAALAGRE